MEIYRVTELTHKEWVFGPALRCALRTVSVHNPQAQVISVTLRVDNTLWEWVFKDEELKKNE